MPLVTLAIFVIVVIAALYLVRYIPDATLQTIVKIVIVIGAVLWILTNIHALLHCCST